jgi:hypothetical protein
MSTVSETFPEGPSAAPAAESQLFATRVPDCASVSLEDLGGAPSAALSRLLRSGSAETATFQSSL